MSAEPEAQTEAIDPVGHIVRTPGVMSGRPRIAGTRIRVQDIASHHLIFGESIDEILDGFPFLTAADVYAALAYYFDHESEIASHREEDAEFEERFLAEYPNTASRLEE